MADRSVSVRLRLKISEFEAGANGVKKNLTGLNRKFAETAGFAKGFRRKLEDATKKLPPIEIDANSSPADVKIAELRSKLESLSKKEIGVDIDASQALVEMSALQRELEAIGDGASFDVRADIGKALVDLNAVMREVQRLDGQKVEIDIEADRTFADRLRAQVELAARSLPKIPVDADSTPAQVKIAELREKLVSLADKKIGVDIDSAAAVAEIAVLERELSDLTESNEIDVRVNAGGALAELRAISSEVDRVGDRPALVSVNADVAGALASIAMVGAALASLPAVTSIAVGVTALGSAFAAAGVGAAAFGAVAVPSLGRINEALKAQASAAQSAGAATGGAGQSAAQAAQQAMQLEQAEKRLKDAQADARTAQEDLTRAREAGRRALEDMNFSLDRSVLSQKDAALAVKEAAARLDEVNADAKSSDLDRERAALNYEMALQRAEEQEVKTARARKDTVAANRAGVEGTKEYTRAQDNLKQAQAKVTEATAALKQMQLQQQAAMSGGGGAAAKLKDAFADLSKEEKILAKDMQAFSKEYIAWQRSLQPEVFPVIAQGLDLMRLGLKEAGPLAKSASGALLTLGKDAEKALRGPFWQEFLDDVNKEIPGAITGLGRIGGDVFEGFAGIIQAFLPHTGDVLTAVEKISQGFSDWGTNLKGSPEFEAFVQYAKENGPKVVEVVRNIAEFIGKIAQVGAGVGPGVLDFLVTLSDKLAGLDQAQIEAVAKGVALIFAAVKLGASLKIGALVLLAQVLSEMSPGQIQALAIAIGAVILAVKSYQAVTGAAGFFQGLSGSLDSAGKSADGAKGKLGNLAGVLGKGGVIAAAAAGTVLAVDSIGDAIDGLNPDIDKLGDRLGDFGKGGQPAAELLDQLDMKLAPLPGRFEDFGDSAARLASDNPFQQLDRALSGFLDDNLGLQLDGGRQAIDNLDQALSTMVANGNGEQAAQAFNRLAKQAGDAGVPVDKLKELFPEYAGSLDGVIPQTNDLATAMGTLGVKVDPLAVAMDKFNSGLDTFNAKTDVAERTLALKDAFNEAKDAIEKAGGKLDFTSRMTDKQREAVILARDQFGGYISKVLEAARGAGELAGKTGEAALKSDEARDAFIRQLPQLFDLAGKSKEAKDRIYDMAAGFGVNRSQADKAASGVKGVKDVIAELKSKTVSVGANTSNALDALGALGKRITDFFSKTYTIQVRTELQEHGARASMRQAAGGIHRYAMGGIERMAQGGTRPQPPGIASKPTILFGEGSSGAGATEAFIPYEMRYRDRATALLAQVANDFGLSLNNEQAAQGLADLSVTIDDSGLMIADRMSLTMRSLESTMGQAGTLTSSINNVGTVGQSLASTWETGSDALVEVTAVTGTTIAGSVTSMGKAVGDSVSALQKQVTELKKALNEAKSSGSKSSGSDDEVGLSATKTMGSLKPKGGMISGSGPKKSTNSNMIEGSLPAFAAGGIVSRPTLALIAERGREAIIPLDDARRGRVMLGQAAHMMSGPTNSSRVSRPQQVRGGGSAAVSGGPGGGSGSGGASVNLYGTTIRENVDADVVTAKIAMVLDSRG